MNYQALLSKMNGEIATRNTTTTEKVQKAKKDTRKYSIIGASVKSLNGCKYYEVDKATEHYSTNDYYKVLSQLRRGGANTGVSQEIKKGLEINGVKCDAIVNTAQVMYEDGKTGEKVFTTYIDSIDTFNNERILRDTILEYLKDGYVKEWKSPKQFATANGNLYNIEGDEIIKVGD